MRPIIFLILLTTVSATRADDAFWVSAENNQKVTITKTVPQSLQGKYLILKIAENGKWVDVTSGDRAAIFLDLQSSVGIDGIKGLRKPVNKVAIVNFSDGTPLKAVVRLGDFTDITIKRHKETDLFVVIAEETMPGQAKQSFTLLCAVDQ